MTRAVAVILFAAAAVLVAGSPHGPAQSVVVPSQAAHYQPPVVLSKADAARLDRIIELLESIERNTAPAAKAVKAGPDRLAVAKAKCAVCHIPVLADSKGGGFILFADDRPTALKPLSTREFARVKEAVESGAMPPSGKLSPAERSAFTK